MSRHPKPPGRKDEENTANSAPNTKAEPTTKAFADTYGEAYRQLVISWFGQAAQNANA